MSNLSVALKGKWGYPDYIERSEGEWADWAEGLEKAWEYTKLLIPIANATMPFYELHGLNIDAEDLHKAWKKIPKEMRDEIEA